MLSPFYDGVGEVHGSDMTLRGGVSFRSFQSSPVHPRRAQRGPWPPLSICTIHLFVQLANGHRTASTLTWTARWTAPVGVSMPRISAPVTIVDGVFARATR